MGGVACFSGDAIFFATAHDPSACSLICSLAHDSVCADNGDLRARYLGPSDGVIVPLTCQQTPDATAPSPTTGDPIAHFRTNCVCR